MLPSDTALLDSYARRGATMRLEELNTEIALLTSFLNGHQRPQTQPARVSPLRGRRLSAAHKAHLSRLAKARWRAHRAKHGRTRLR